MWRMTEKPISPVGRARSVLVLQADGAGHFDPDQLALYARLVRDVAHAIESIDAETARRQEQRLREQLMESVAGLFFVVDAQGRLLLLANAASEDATNLSFERAFGAIIGRLDLIVNLLGENSRRIGIGYAQGLMLFNFLPVR